MAIGQTLSAEEFNKRYGTTTPGTTLSKDAFNQRYSGFPTEEPAQIKSSFMDKLKSLGNALIAPEKTLGQGLSTVFDKTTQQTVTDTNRQDADAQQSLVDAIRREADPAKKDRLAQSLKTIYGTDYKATEDGDLNTGFDLSNKQVLGAGAGVALDVITAGSYGNAAKGAKTGQLLTKPSAVATKIGTEALGEIAKPTTGQKLAAFGKGFAKAGAKAAPVGVGYGVSGAMQEDLSLKDAVKRGVTGGLLSAIISGTLGGRAAVKAEKAPYKAQQLHKKAIEQYKKGLGASKEKFKEMSDDVVPELLKDKKWGSRSKLLADAEAGVKLSAKQYNELGELQGVAEIDGILGKIDDEMAKLKTPQGKLLSVNKGKYKALQGLKDDVTQYISADKSRSNASFQQLRESYTRLDEQKKKLLAQGAKETSKPVKELLENQRMIETQMSKEIVPVASQAELRGLAEQYGDLLYDTRKSQKTIADNATLSQIKKGDAMIRDLLATKNPTYAKINKLYTHSNNLKDILNETAQRDSSGLGMRITRDVMGAGSGMVGGAIVGGIPGAVVGTVVTSSAVELLQSTWWNTMRAVQKEKLAEKLLNFSPEKRNQAIIRLGRFGAKAAEEMGLLD